MMPTRHAEKNQSYTRSVWCVQLSFKSEVLLMWLPHLQYLQNPGPWTPLPHDHGLHHGDTDATLNSLSHFLATNGGEGQIKSNGCHGECILMCTIYYVLIENRSSYSSLRCESKCTLHRQQAVSAQPTCRK